MWCLQWDLKDVWLSSKYLHLGQVTSVFLDKENNEQRRRGGKWPRELWEVSGWIRGCFHYRCSPGQPTSGHLLFCLPGIQSPLPKKRKWILIPFMRAPLSWPKHLSKTSHFLVPSYWALGSQHTDLREMQIFRPGRSGKEVFKWSFWVECKIACHTEMKHWRKWKGSK